MGEPNNSTFLIKSSADNNRSFGTGFCIFKDDKGSFLLTAGHVVESCGRDELLVETKKAILLHISDENDTIDLALIYVEGLTQSSTLKLSDEKAQEEDKFTIVGYRPHKSDHAKEPLKGFIKKSYPLESKDYKRDMYTLTINDGDSIEQGYSGSAVVSEVTGLVVAVATDRKTNGKQAYATPAYYIKEIWKDMPDGLFVSYWFPKLKIFDVVVKIAQKYLLTTVVGVIVLGLVTNFIYDMLKSPSNNKPKEAITIIKENNSTNSTIELHNDGNSSTTQKKIDFSKNQTKNSTIKVFQ
jgi:S1-C subfamily serine protease